ncbi:MAG: hypothetical protein K2G26_01375 [Clostridia bacterium]|nr:hypothetical protein [Clostridia bacterium]
MEKSTAEYRMAYSVEVVGDSAREYCARKRARADASNGANPSVFVIPKGVFK